MRPPRAIPYTTVDTANPHGERSWLVATLATVILLQVAFVNVWPGFPSPSERGRAYQALAVVHRGALAIDEELACFGAMEDVAGHGGRLYPNKAPGLLPILVPAALLAHALAGASPDRELALTLALGRLLAASLPLLLTAGLLHRSCRAWPGGRRLAIVATVLASPLLTASLLLFSHAFCALLLLAASLLLRQPPRPLAPALAGFLLAWSFAAEYPTVVPGVVLLLCALPKLGARSACAAVLGGVPPLLALAAYNAACFGSPMALSSGHEADPAFAHLAASGVFGVGWPTPAGLAELLASPARGLLVWVPLLLLVAVTPMLPRQERRMVLPGLAALAASIVMLAGYPNRHGGWFAGPRYLLHALPLAVPAIAAVLHRLRENRAGAALSGAAVLWSLAATWLCLVSFPFPPEDFPLPWVTLAPQLLRDGIFAPSWLPASVAPWLFAGLWVAGIVIVLAAVPRRARAIAAFLAVLALAGVSPMRAPDSFKAQLEKAVIHDVYLGGRGDLEALAARANGPGERRLVASWLARREAQLPLGPAGLP